VTRAALRILSRARADAWRRVGMPTTWEPEAAAPATDAEAAESTGQNVAGPANGHAGNGRPARTVPNANDETSKD
jgi:hypothetical protein